MVGRGRRRGRVRRPRRRRRRWTWPRADSEGSSRIPCGALHWRGGFPLGRGRTTTERRRRNAEGGPAHRRSSPCCRRRHYGDRSLQPTISRAFFKNRFSFQTRSTVACLFPSDSLSALFNQIHLFSPSVFNFTQFRLFAVLWFFKLMQFEIEGNETRTTFR